MPNPRRAKSGSVPRLPGGLTPQDFFSRARLRLFGVIFVLSFLIGLIVSQGAVRGTTVLREGTFARKSVRAPYDFEIVDEAATETKRQEAMAAVPLVLNHDPDAFEEARLRIQGAFVKAQAALMTEGMNKEKAPEVLDAFSSEVGAPLSDSGRETLLESRFDQRLADAAQRILREAADWLILDRLDDLSALAISTSGTTPAPVLAVRNDVSGDERVLNDTTGLTDVTGARRRVEDAAKKHWGGEDDGAADVIAQLAKSQIRTNVRVDNDLVNERRLSAAKEVIPVKLVYKKNQLIVGEGRNVTAEHAKVMRWLDRQESRKTAIPRLLGITFLLSFLIFFAFYIADINLPDFHISEIDFAFLGGLLLASLALYRLMLFLGNVIADQTALFPAQVMMFLYPASFAPMLVRFVRRFEVALVFAVCFALVGALPAQADVPLSVYLFISGLVGAHAIGKAHRRVEVLRAGVTVGMINLGMVGCFLLLGFGVEQAVSVLGAAFLGGILSGFFVIAAAPLVELAFGYMTPISLLELANYDHPLLRRIMTQTPGTFQHSVTIGSLAEAAAERIGADALLCRVGALFHDAGKSANAEYFVENQGPKNPHDIVDDPYRSADIIKRHVTEGVELARQYKLGERIIDFIREHHGTGKIAYFYNRALEQAGGDTTKVDEARFTYEGPRPRSKETGIMIIADAVEATSRAMKERTPEAVTTMINKTITRIMDSGQLDDCPLTQRDLAVIAESFAHVINGIHMNRADYKADESPPAPAAPVSPAY